MSTKNINKDEQGFILPVLVITVLLMLSILMYVGSMSLTTYNLAARDTYRANAQLAADAGLDYSIREFNLDNTWTGTTGEVNLLDTARIRTTFQSAILDGPTTDKKTVSVVARTYSPGSSTTPKVTRRYEVDLLAVTSPLNGPSSVVSGVGGLVLNNNSKITGGDVVVNGTITIGNNAQIGLSTTLALNAVNVRVAHTNCPTPATSAYPRVCGTGENGQPIQIDTNGRIYGDVRATNQVNGTNMFNPGLIPNQTVAPITLPDHDRGGQIAAVAQTLTSTDNTVACGNNQTKTWPANIKITGDVSLGNGCTVNLSGNVWLTGSLTFGNNAIIKVPNSASTTTPVVMIDGPTGIVISNNGRVVPNNLGTGAYFIAYWSAASCSPDCTNVTGVDLKNSQNVVKVDLTNNGSAAGSILYARWSRTRVSNNGAIGAVAGQSIELGENAVINFTSSVPGSDNQVTTWVKRGYMRVYD